MNKPRPDSVSSWSVSSRFDLQLSGGVNPEPWSEISHSHRSSMWENNTEILLFGSSLFPCFAAFTNASCNPKCTSACQWDGIQSSSSSKTGNKYSVDVKLTVIADRPVIRGNFANTVNPVSLNQHCIYLSTCINRT